MTTNAFFAVRTAGALVTLGDHAAAEALMLAAINQAQAEPDDGFGRASLANIAGNLESLGPPLTARLAPRLTRVAADGEHLRSKIRIYANLAGALAGTGC